MIAPLFFALFHAPLAVDNPSVVTMTATDVVAIQSKRDDKNKPKAPAGGDAKADKAKDTKGEGSADFEPLLTERGLAKSADGDWLNEDEQKKAKEGWSRQDLEWVAPNEADNVAQGKWKCGDKWLSIDDANAYHSKVGQWWRLRGKHFDVYSTCKRDVALEALKEADSTHAHLERIYGRTPPMRPIVLVLNSPEQYNSFATGEGRSSPDLRGLSSIHGAFFAELWTEPFERGSYSGSGVCYFDASNDDGWRYGRTFARHAAGQSFGEALDPSVETLASTKKWKDGEFQEAFWAEKKLPQWFRYGGAAYVERYFVDPTAADPKAMLKWAVQNIANKGGLDQLKKIYGLEFGGDERERSVGRVRDRRRREERHRQARRPARGLEDRQEHREGRGRSRGRDQEERGQAARVRRPVDTSLRRVHG
jgi:hypothetical protein